MIISNLPTTDAIDECLGNPCGENAQRCNPLLNVYQCVCKRGWVGLHCETSTYNLFVCKCTMCCVVYYTHKCKTGYIRFFTDIDDCVGVVCAFDGDCVDGIDSFTCNCTPGRKGTNCSTGEKCVKRDFNSPKRFNFYLIIMVIPIIIIMNIINQSQ